MASDKTVLYFGPGRTGPSPIVSLFVEENGLELDRVDQAADLRALLNRTMPACVVMESASDSAEFVDIVRVLKEDSFTSIVPLMVLLMPGDDGVSDLLAAGADEVVHDGTPEREKQLRLGLVLRRADRDVSVHPTMRLPGTTRIARDMQARLARGERFGVCYADLDHFKEFNDRYGYAFGDGVIRLLSRILRDAVRGFAPGGFVGHIGGDDFIFNVPTEYLEATCDEVIYLFDELIPYQYTE
jgi:GGDEF domain-containing protein